MSYHAFERTDPEKAGISNDLVWRLLDELEHEKTQMRGLLIMKDGKLCVEGWWKPFSAGNRHGNQSLTKTYAATAVGIAFTKGMLSLQDRIIDLFPEYAGECPEGLIQELKVCDVLSMSCGMEEMPKPSEHWIRDFIGTKIVHRPGTRFFYNSVGSNLLAAIVERVSGKGMVEFLEMELFPKIGIRKQDFCCYEMPDGTAVGGAGSYAMLEANLRLLKLYADGGKCGDEQILSGEFVELATTKRIETKDRPDYDPKLQNGNCGYGYQIWMCDEPETYRADGAFGQFVIVNKPLHLLVAIQESAVDIDGPEMTLEAVMHFIRALQGEDVCNPGKITAEMLRERIKSLAISDTSVICEEGRAEKFSGRYGGRVYRKESGLLDLECNILPLVAGYPETAGVEWFSFSVEGGMVKIDFSQNGVKETLSAATEGSMTYNQVSFCQAPVTKVYYKGEWENDSTYILQSLWLENCNVNETKFCFSGQTCHVFTRVLRGSFETKVREAVFSIHA